MTYCFGCKDKNGTVYLWADSAGTGSQRPQTDHSSFGELHAEVRGEHVEESLLKLIPIAPGVIAAYAGDSLNARKCLETLKENISSFAGDWKGLLRSLSISMGKFPKGREVALLLAISSEDGKNALLHWDSEEGLNPSNADCYWIGSLESYHARITPEFASRFSAANAVPDRMQVAITALIQSYGIHDNMIEQNIGGAFFGIRTKLGKIEWQENTDYFIYSRDNNKVSINGFISVIQRDNVIVAESTYADGKRALASSVSFSRTIIDDGFDEWKTQVSQDLQSTKKKNVIFLGVQDRSITMVYRPEPDKQGNLFQMAYSGEGVHNLSLNQRLIDVLLEPTRDIVPGAIPYRIRQLID